MDISLLARISSKLCHVWRGESVELKCSFELPEQIIEFARNQCCLSDWLSAVMRIIIFVSHETCAIH